MQIPHDHTFRVLLGRPGTYLYPPMLVEEGRKMNEKTWMSNGETERMETKKREKEET